LSSGFKLRTLCFAFVAFSIFFVSGPIQTVYSSEEGGLDCEVEITGGESRMYPGQSAMFKANLSEVQGTENYTWTVEGPIIKEYDDNVDNGTLFNVSRNIEPPTLMSPDDFQESSISFYWQPNATDMNRTVSVTVQTSDGEICEDSKDFTVAMSMDDIDKQAEDFYVVENHPIPTENTTSVLQEHQDWHSRYRGPEASYFDQGDLFFDFHNLFIAHFDAWRELFGYPSIIEWNPGSPIPRGVEIDHDARYGYRNASDQQPLPSWFDPRGGGEDGIRPIFFIQNETGYPQQIPPGHLLEGHRVIIFVSTSNPALDDNTRQFLQQFEGHTFPLCEEWDAPDNSSKYAIEQDALNDFDPDKELLGCALTYPYHDTTHGRVAGNRNGTSGDMASTGTSPIDPIFWRFHKFVDSVSTNRSQIEEPAPTLALDEEAGDTIPPRVFAQNPFRLYPFLTELPTISEQERDLFGVAGVPALSAEFSEPVTGVTAKDFTVNGSPATQVYGKGAGPYIFIGFSTPGIGPVNVTFAPGNITDEAGNRFEGSTWSYEIVEPTADKDIDGVMDGLEVNLWRLDPNRTDTDGDTINDGVEVSSGCLNPLVHDIDAGMMGMGMFTLSLPVNDSDNNNNTMGMTTSISGNSSSSSSSLDSDSDGMSNVQEINNKTDPCSPEKPQQSLQVSEGLFLSADNATAAPLLTQNDSSFPFGIVIQKSGGIAASSASNLSYDSLSKLATSIVNGSKASRQISDFDEQEAKRLLNNSGFFGLTTTYYPPPSGSADYIEFTVIATLNGRLHAVHWTDVSEGVPEPIRNLPYIMAYVLGTGRVF
jgi:hypothetical protein